MIPRWPKRAPKGHLGPTRRWTMHGRRTTKRLSNGPRCLQEAPRCPKIRILIVLVDFWSLFVYVLSFFVEFWTFFVQFGATRPQNYGKLPPVFPQLFPRRLGEHTVQHLGQIWPQRFAPSRWGKKTCKKLKMHKILSIRVSNDSKLITE